LKKLEAAARASDLAQRWRQLSRVIDTNIFARYLAMQVLTVNWDGYALFKNNYRVYHDPDYDHLFFIAHGMDQMFGKPFAPLMPPRWDGLVARAFMETSEGRARFTQQIGILFTNVYHTEALARRVDELGARVRPILAERSEFAAEEHDRLVRELRQRIERRGDFLKQQFATTNWDVLPVRSPTRIQPVQ